MIRKHQQKPGGRLGEGVYHLAEAARYTQLHPARVRSWFVPRSDGTRKHPVFHSDYAKVGTDRAISFLDLIDVLVAGQLRELGVSMPTVRKAYNVLKTQLKTTHPFCHQDLRTDGKRVFLVTATELDDVTLREVVSTQQYFRNVLPHLQRLSYSEADKLAQHWDIEPGVMIDPAISFGKPVVAATGTTTFVIANCVKANGGDVELVADLFDLSPTDVRNAVEFENNYKTRRAA